MGQKSYKGGTDVPFKANDFKVYFSVKQGSRVTRNVMDAKMDFLHRKLYLTIRQPMSETFFFDLMESIRMSAPTVVMVDANGAPVLGYELAEARVSHHTMTLDYSDNDWLVHILHYDFENIVVTDGKPLSQGDMELTEGYLSPQQACEAVMAAQANQAQAS
jgi:hypothetical protein